MSKHQTIYIWDGGVFSPPTRATGKLAYNISSYIATKYPNHKIEFHFVPTNKYYNKPWVRCVEESDRIKMLDNLVTYINKEYKVSPNIKFVVNDNEIKLGKKVKSHIETLHSLKDYFKKKSFNNIFLSNSIDVVIKRVKGHWTNSLKLLFDCKTICYDIFSDKLIGINQSDNYVYKSIDLKSLLEQANFKFPKEVSNYFNEKKISKKQIEGYIKHDYNASKFEGLKKLIMKQILFLPKHLVPESYKAYAGNRVREELDVYYSSINNIQKLTTPGIENYITDNRLYEHCKSTYKDKLISKSKSKKSYTKKDKKSYIKKNKTRKGKKSYTRKGGTRKGKKTSDVESEVDEMVDIGVEIASI